MTHRTRNMGRFDPTWIAKILVAMIFFAGCSRGPRTITTEESHDMEMLKEALSQATFKLKRAPKDVDELKPFLQDPQHPEKTLNSPRDGKPYVIVWGTMPFGGIVAQPGQSEFLAYEQEGINDEIYVLTVHGPTIMKKVDFQKLNLPRKP